MPSASRIDVSGLAWELFESVSHGSQKKGGVLCVSEGGEKASPLGVEEWERVGKHPSVLLSHANAPANNL